MSEQAGKHNRYRCDRCGESIVTINRDAGTTPMLIDCKVTEGCQGIMRSAWYPPEAQIVSATWEWYRPRKSQMRRLRRADTEMADHCERGGLLLRPAGVMP